MIKFILEVETGFIDGWYQRIDVDLEGIKKSWDQWRPDFTHIICSTNDSEMFLPDHRRLSRCIHKDGSTAN